MINFPCDSLNVDRVTYAWIMSSMKYEEPAGIKLSLRHKIKTEVSGCFAPLHVRPPSRVHRPTVVKQAVWFFFLNRPIFPSSFQRLICF